MSSNALTDRVLGLAADLRQAGVDVSLAEALDAIRALTHLELLDRDVVRIGLQATLVKRPEDLAAFGVLFDRHFSLTARSDDRDVAGAAPGHGSTPGGASVGGLAGSLVEALRTGDDVALRVLAGEAVARYAGMDSQQAGERYFSYRVFRALDVSNLLIAAIARHRADHPDASPAELRRVRDDVRARLEHYRRLVLAEIRQRLTVGAPVGSFRPRHVEDLDVLHASTTELRQLRAAVRPLARKLASRIGQRRRRHRRGRIDMRRTLRRSLDAGGTPFAPVFHRAHVSKPRLVVLCDISGSVAEFARFTLMLLDALRNEIAGLRTFVFVDGIAEVTHVLSRAEVSLDPRLLVRLPGVVSHDGHSDYERALRSFVERFDDALGPSTTVLVAGDARTNYRGAGLESLRLIRRRCRRLYWFNPEPRHDWGDADSELPAYAELCDGVFEVRSLAQLADAVAAIV